MSLPLAPSMAELVRRVRLEALFPPFADLALDLIQRCYERGSSYYAIAGLRSWDEQDALYRLGRIEVAPGHWRVHDKAEIRTNARAGASTHNYGIALDLALDADMDRAGLQPGWHSYEYDVLASEAVKLGLDSGHLWSSLKDSPHVQLDLSRYGISLRALETMHQRGGLGEVHEFLSAFDWRAPR